MRSLIFGGLILLLAALWQRDVPPGYKTLSSAMLKEPEQTVTRKPAFKVEIDGITYTIRPLFQYELHGLVVSRHESDSWWDYIHREWNDKLNVADLCVVWGANIKNGAYENIDFSSGQFVCNFSTDSSEAFAAFDQTAISNNHLLTNRPEFTRKLKNVRVGDQIHFKGYLAEYSHQHGMPFTRGSSTVRTDTGNGACETVFLEEFTILRQNAVFWRNMVWVASGMILAGLAAWWRLPHRSSL
jgi:hypothetical protein